MGISGLLPLLKSIHKPCNLKSFAGKSIGVDAYGWLHRGTIACAIDLATGKPTTKHIDFCMSRVRMLLHFGIKPYLVFDGDHLPGKAGTNKERASKRRESRKEGMELLKLGKTSQAHLELQKAVDVTPEMARLLIEELKKHKIDYVVAPYEADSQLAYLERKGLVHGILSEDSDLLVFGAKCLITKLDQYGECVVIDRNDFTKCREISLVGWSDAEFRQMAILSGCDYLPNISKMGLKTAYRLLRKYKTVDRLLRAIQFDGQYKVPAGYAEAYKQAEMTFLYQWVFCPLSNRLVNFTEPEPELDISTLLYIGRHIEPEIATAVASGDLHPKTKLPIELKQLLQPPSRPLMPLSRTKSVTETPDLKKSMSIESFFKPKRTPLAELDPNIFTPSPSQQQVLQQQNRGSWTAWPAPSQPALTRSNTFSASVPARRTISEQQARRQSTPHPAKRQRLCSDTMILPGPDGSFRVESGSSRFFASSTATEPSPSVRRRKASRAEFELWSDDSLEEAMAELPDPSISDDIISTKKSKISVFTDTESVAESQSTEASQSVFSTSVQDSQQSGAVTPATSCGSQVTRSESQTSFFGDSLSGEIKDLRAKFAYQPDSSEAQRPALKRTGSGAVKALQRTASTPMLKPGYFSLSQVSTCTTASARSTQTTKESKTTSTTARPENQKPLSTASTDAPPSYTPAQPTSCAENLEIANSQPDIIEDEAWTVSGAEIVVPNSSQPQPTVDVPAVAEATATPQTIKDISVGESAAPGKGSEDLLLVPDSASEGDAESDDEQRMEALKRKLDLGRFRLGAGA